MWPVKQQNKKHTNALVEVFGKANIEEFRIYWSSWSKKWCGNIEWESWPQKCERSFTNVSFEELVREMAEFSEKNLLLEIK